MARVVVSRRRFVLWPSSMQDLDMAMAEAAKNYTTLRCARCRHKQHTHTQIHTRTHPSHANDINDDTTLTTM